MTNRKVASFLNALLYCSALLQKHSAVLSPLLFIIVMEAVTHNVREGLPWEMLYADDLVLVGKCEENNNNRLF